jgi:spore coat protein U-like protein
MTFHLRRILPGLLLLMAGTFSAPLWASSCTIDTASANVGFGNYDPVSAIPNTANGSISITCTPNCNLFFLFFCLNGYNGVNAAVSLTPGNSGSYLSRSLKSGSNVLLYNLYSTPDYSSTIFGDGSMTSSKVTYCFTGTDVPSCSGATYPGQPASGGGGNNGTPQNQGIPIYGKIPANQDASVGNYTDTISATVTF